MSIGKKILSAFVEIEEDEEDKSSSQENEHVISQNEVRKYSVDVSSPENTLKFKTYFDKLLNDSKSNGPDYLAFTKMTEAMSVIPDEKSRYIAAFAGLAAQGLTKQQLIQTANSFLDILEKDHTHFNETINVAIAEKVKDKKFEIEEKSKRIHDLTLEINNLNNEISVLKNKIAENEEKLTVNSAGYNNESSSLKTKISQDIEKIKQYLS